DARGGVGSADRVSTSLGAGGTAAGPGGTAMWAWREESAGALGERYPDDPEAQGLCQGPEGMSGDTDGLDTAVSGDGTAQNPGLTAAAQGVGDGATAAGDGAQQLADGLTGTEGQPGLRQ